eukprot:1150339-Pelagomonas_calceolata.AAC.2
MAKSVTGLSASAQLPFRHNPTLRATTANRVRQPHQLNVNQRHVHLIEIKYCEDLRPGQQLESAQPQRADLCQLGAETVNLSTIFLGVSGTYYIVNTLDQFKQLGLDHQRANKLARKLHAHSVMYANKLVTTGCAIENNHTSHSQILEPGASTNPPDPDSVYYFTALWWKGLTALLSQCVFFSFADVGRVSEKGLTEQVPKIALFLRLND